jgi:hypothetical protein
MWQLISSQQRSTDAYYSLGAQRVRGAQLINQYTMLV